MRMNRRDVIIISVLINLGLLAALFVTAIKSDSDSMTSTVDIQQVAMAKDFEPAPLLTFAPEEKALDAEMTAESIVLDEVDHVLKEYLPETPVEVVSIEREAPTSIGRAPAAEPIPPENPKETLVDVTVKRGDALEKIARANHTTIEAIKKANHLTNDKLKIGQVLKVPVGTAKSRAQESPKAKQKTLNGPVAEGEPLYYVIKNGDNPWKIAKQYGVKFEDLLRLNSLDEEKARNLKVGDEIRVR